MHNELAGGRVTLADVAQFAGVSSKTVSNVVHHHPHVSAELRARVKAAIDELGYRPNLTARQLVTGKTGMIALAIPWIDQPYFSELSKFIGEEANRQGYRIIYEQTANNEEAERAVLRDREQGLVDGVIFHPVMIDTLEIARLRPGTPVVLLGESARPITTDHVMIDNVRAAREGVELLLAQGRRRIAFHATVRDDVTGSTHLRLVGYQEALLAAGLPLDPNLVIRSEGWTFNEATSSIAGAIRDGVQFDAVLCRDDFFAMGALKALAAAGIAVPSDVAVVGWDDTPHALYCTPTLTTVSPDKDAIARTALRLLKERIDGYTGIGRHEIVGHTIVERMSTQPREHSAL